jgi:Uma2 family endonuclease
MEERSPIRHEFLDGSIYAMAGGTPEHAAMTAAIVSSLGAQMKTCRVYSSDLRVRVLSTGLATYPDVTVICGPSERDPASRNHVTNPTLLVEVLSNATQDYDRGEKLEHYKRIPSLRVVLLVDHTKPEIVVWSRHDDEWSSAVFGPGQDIVLDAVGANLRVDEVYAAARDA